MKLSVYGDFNRSKNTGVCSLWLNGRELGALCRYQQSSLDELLLPETTLTYVAAGEKRMLVNNREYFLQAGDLLYLPKHSVVFSEIPETDISFESINICIPEELGETALHNNVLLFKKQSEIQTIYNALYPQFTGEENDSAAIGEKLNELLAHCRSRIAFEVQKNIHPDDATRVVKTLTEYLYEPLGSPEMAEISHMSLASWKRKFEALFHESPKSWIRKRRLEKAYFRLSTEKISVTDVCEMVGFGNNAHFSQQFRKYFGISPGAVRRNQFTTKTQSTQ